MNTKCEKCGKILKGDEKGVTYHICGAQKTICNECNKGFNPDWFFQLELIKRKVTAKGDLHVS